MPPKGKVSKAILVTAAVELVRRDGARALNARALATAAGCSTQPIFSYFTGMEEVRAAVMAEAYRRYQDFQVRDIAAGVYPPYKASGMSYIRFAHEERELFRLLFMRHRTEEVDTAEADLEPLYAMIQTNVGISREQAQLFHLESWIFVHGIATLVVTGYQVFEESLISDMLTDIYRGLHSRFQEKGD